MFKLATVFLTSALAASVATTAMAGDLYTPYYLKRLAQKADLITGVNEFIESMSLSAGMLSAVLTVQDLGLAPRAICPPNGKDGKPDNFEVSFKLYQSLRSADISGFPATDQGGAMFVYTVLVKAYPCK